MISFLKQYIKNPQNIGAIAPSTKYLAKEMIKGIDFDNTKCIVEYGAGTGVFTEEIVKNASKKTKIFVFETNYTFYMELKNKYKIYPNVIVMNESAEKAHYCLQNNNIKNVDYIISGLPFTSLPKQTSNRIIENTKNLLHSNGEFRTFQYSLLKKKLFENHFSNISHTKIYKNVPPAYVLRCKNTK